MAPVLLNKRSRPLLGLFSGDSINSPSASALRLADDQEDPSYENEMKLRPGSSKVWSDIRGAIKAIRRSSRGSKHQNTLLAVHEAYGQIGSHGSTVLE